MLQNPILVALGVNDVSVISSPEGTAATIMGVPAIGSGIGLSNHFPDKSATDLTTDCLDTHGVAVIPTFIPVIQFPCVF